MTEVSFAVVKTKATTKLRRMVMAETRRASRLCLQCGARLFPGDQANCEECRYKRKETCRRYRKNAKKAGKELWITLNRKKNPKKYAEMSKTAYWHKKENGICIRCVLDASDDSNFCEFHRDEDRAKSRGRIVLKQLKTIREWNTLAKKMKLVFPETSEICNDIAMAA